MRLDGFDVDVIVQGFPGKSVCHGALGWSTIALLRRAGRVILIDAGSFGMRRLLIDGLTERGLSPADVTDVILSHAHYDHAVNWVLFPKARIVIGGEEIDWAVEQPPGETPVAELYMRELRNSPQLHRAADGEEVAPGITAHQMPGHTPGHLVYRLAGDGRDVVFSGDAAKNRAELLSRRADTTLDPELSSRSIERIWALWRRHPGNILVPGHDVPMMLEDGRPSYLGRREAAITAWFGEDLATTTLFRLSLA